MSTLGEHKGNGNLTETSLQPKDTKEQIYGLLQHFDVLPSRFDRFIFKYIAIFLLGFFFPSELLLILFLLSISPQLQAQAGGVLLGGVLSGMTVVVFLLTIWLFNVWRLRTPKTLRDLFEQKHIDIPDGDATSSYLIFLENYHNTLGSTKRYFLSGFPMIVFGILPAYEIVQILFVIHLTSFVTILGVVGTLLFTLEALGGLYCFGIVIWALYVSGRYIRKLVRTFEFSIQPFHPDQCGGLKMIGNFCFGLVSPLLLFSGFSIGYSLLILGTRGLGTVFQATNVGFPLFILLYTFPVIVFAFLLPLWDIHSKMVSEGETDEKIYVARIQALREELQALLDTNQVEEAKAVQEKKALVETLYIPYPTWPFRFRSKIFSTVLGVSGSLLIGVITAALQQYFLPAILPLLFHKP